MVRKESLHRQVVRHLALRILHGEFSLLPNEADLCQQLKISRPILREAIKVLSAKGLLTVGPKTGTRVRPRRDWNLLDPQLLEWQAEDGIEEHFFHNVCEIRSIIEPKAAELAALRANEEDLVEIQAAWQQMCTNAQEVEAFITADLWFHNAIMEASHNELLYQVVSVSSVALRTSRALSAKAPRAISSSLPIHRKVFEAIQCHDSTAARQAMEKLIKMATGQIAKALDYSAHRTTREQQKFSPRLEGRH
jgi:GntR family transcriptional regulator, galactonate operon transcriptional repressor